MASAHAVGSERANLTLDQGGTQRPELRRQCESCRRQTIRLRTVALNLLVGALLLLVAQPAFADLLYPPGSSFNGGGDDGGATATFSPSFTFTYYNTGHTNVRVSYNGVVGWTAPDGSPYGQALNNAYGQSVIAPFWADLNSSAGNFGNTGGIYTYQDGSIFSITYRNAYVYGASSDSNRCQVTLFGQDKTLKRSGTGNIFNFKSGDIVLSYDWITFSAGTVTVGLKDGAGTGNYTGVPNAANGQVSAANKAWLPTAAESFLLYRPDATGTNYTVAVTNFVADPNPTVTTTNATGVGTYGATLNGSIAATGTAQAVAFFFWGTTDQGTNIAAWSRTNSLGPVTVTGAVSNDLTGLSPATTYYYVCAATNANGAGVGSTMSFTTWPVPPPLIADYQFNSNLQSSVAGAPDLTFPATGGGGSGSTPNGYTNDPVIGRPAFVFPSASGLTFPSGTLLGATYSTNYTVGVLFRAEAAFGSGWQALIDPSGGSSDNHTYIQGNQVNIYASSGGSTFGSVTGTNWYQVFLSVGPTGTVVNAACAPVYGPGPLTSACVRLGSPGSGGLYINTSNNRINFFRDDGGEAFPAGRVARIQVYQGAMVTNYMATLNLAVLPPTAPACTTTGATALAAASATLNGNVASTGGAPTTVSFLWDTADHGTNLAQWTHTNVVGVVGTGAVSTNVTGLSAGTTYYYILYATNSAGQSFGTNAVSFTTPAPPVAATLAASGVTLASATLNGSVTTGTAPTTVWFLWDTADRGADRTAWGHTNILGVAGPGSVSTNLGGLASGATYYYLLYATNTYGESCGTPAQSFQTLAPSLGPRVTTAAASGVSPYAATLNGGIGSTGSTATTVFFLYDTVDRGASLGGWAHTTTPVVASSEGAYSTNLSGLNPVTTYYYVLYGTNTDGESFGTNAVSFQTLGLAPSATTLAADGVSASGATLHGTVLSTGTAPTTAYFLWGPADQGTNAGLWAHATASIPVASGQGLSTNLGGLSLATTYYGLLCASNAVGVAFGSPAQPFTTLALPPTIDATAATGVWSTAASLNGILTATNGAVTTVAVYWGTNDAGAASAGWAHTNDFGARSVGTLTTNLTGLAANTVYWYRYFATNSAGGNWSTGVTFRTAPGLIFDRNATQVVGGGDDNIATVTLPFPFTFYNAATNRLRIGSNGACSPKDAGTMLGGGDYYSASWHSRGYPAIAMLWNDMNTTPGDAGGIDGTYGGLATVAGAVYTNVYAVTVPHAFTYRSGWSQSRTEITFQMALFGTNATVRLASGNVFAFHSGDVMVCYADNRLTGFAGNNCAVGVADGAGTYAGMPGTTAGVLSDASRGLLPSTVPEQFVLFRPDATGTNYTSVITNFYIEPIAPTCTTAAATALTTSSATLNGSVTSTGNAPTSVYFLWGPADQGTNVALWAHTNAMGVVSGPGAVSTNLTALTSGATYYYIVYAVSSAGASYGLPAQSFSLPAPPSAATAPATAVTVSSAMLEGSVTTGTAPTTVWFLWDTTDHGASLTGWTHTNVLGGVASSGPVSTNITGLASSTTYYYLTYATNAYGYSFGTNAQSFTTLTPVLVPSVGTDPASAVMADSATLNGTVGSTGASPTTVYFLWGPIDQGTNVALWAHSNLLGVLDVGPIATNITGLSPSTTYYFLAYGVNADGVSYGTNAQSFTTMTPPTASTLAASGISPTAATLHGSVTTGSAPTTVSFLWDTQDHGATVSGWAHTNGLGVVAQGAVATNLTGLAANMPYYFIVYVTNAYGSSFGTPAQVFTTLGLPPTVSSDPASNVTLAAATLNGTLVSTGTAPTTVSVYWGLADGGTNAQAWANTNAFGQVAAGALYTNVTGLPPMTRYYYRYYATNSIGESWGTSGTTFRTATPVNSYPYAGPATNIPDGFGALTTTVTVADTLAVSGVRVAFTGLYHSYVGDLRFWLVGPDNTSVQFFAGTGGSSDFGAANHYGFADTGMAITASAVLPSATYVTANSFDAAFNGKPGKGTWKLVTADVAASDVGGFSGWTLELGGVIVPMPPEVSTLAPSNVLSGSAVLNGALASTGSVPTTVILYWGTADGGTDPAAWANTNSLGVVGVGPLSTNLTGLATGTTHYYRYFATNSAGGMWSTNGATFTTQAGATPPVIDALPASGVSATGATFNGSVVSTGEAPTTVSVYWGLADGGTNAAAWANTNGFGLRGAGSVATNIAGLTPGTTNYYRFYAVNSAGDGWSTSTVAFRTPGASVTFAYGGPSNAIPDPGSITTTLFIAESFTIDSGGVGISFNGLWHPWAGDLKFTLIDPHSNAVVFLNNTGIHGRPSFVAGNTYTFADGGAAQVLTGAWPSGTYAPASSLNAVFAGKQAQGTWKLITQDIAGGDVGGFAGWSLILSKTPYVGPPLIDNLAAANLQDHSASLNGILSSTGSLATAVSLYWGRADGGTNAAAWSNTNEFGVLSPQLLTTNLLGLSLGGTYYYRYYATNSIGGTWSTPSASFELPAHGAVYTFR